MNISTAQPRMLSQYISKREIRNGPILRQLLDLRTRNQVADLAQHGLSVVNSSRGRQDIGSATSKAEAPVAVRISALTLERGMNLELLFLVHSGKLT